MRNKEDFYKQAIQANWPKKSLFFQRVSKWMTAEELEMSEVWTYVYAFPDPPELLPTRESETETVGLRGNVWPYKIVSVLSLLKEPS